MKILNGCIGHMPYGADRSEGQVGVFRRALNNGLKGHFFGLKMHFFGLKAHFFWTETAHLLTKRHFCGKSLFLD